VGKDYKQEILQLPATYEWALRESNTLLSSFMQDIANSSLLSVGSGGSFTAATFSAYLHTLATGQLAKAHTPLDIVTSSLEFQQMAALILTASGKNPDILAAFDALSIRGTQSIGVVKTRSNGPLLERTKGVSQTKLCEFDLPSGKDGYLATNTLLATLILLSRAYCEAGLLSWQPPLSLGLLLGTQTNIEKVLEDLIQKTAPLWQRETLIVLHSNETRAAAIDIESRFSEAALGPVILTDFRNFGHGRHYWLEKRASSTGILALVDSQTRQLARSLLKLSPSSIPIIEFNFSDVGIDNAIATVVASILLAYCAGQAQGCNPGRPKVPDFGRKMYRLKSLSSLVSPLANGGLSSNVSAAISRKTRCSVEQLRQRRLLEPWINAYENFIASLKNTEFSGIAFDYDGTLCEASRRYEGLNHNTVEALLRFLEAGIPIVVATGRGKSVREQLQASLPSNLWNRIFIGYYNGSDTAPLNDNNHPESGHTKNGQLQKFYSYLSKNSVISRIAEFDERPWQLTATPVPGVDILFLWEIINTCIMNFSPIEIRAFRSDHSIDIMPSSVSKKNVLIEAKKYFKISPDLHFLAIGDRGSWPGNDCELLSGPFSLSVDEPSANPESCWNIASPCSSHIEATLEYLDLIDILEGCLRFSSQRFGRGV
jgi:hydroxymethylpyrimidine pyrophosphatase-like HAD family hydrolase